jgi:1-acyl-sn-glycerol-3-phosphate acyltransferase
LIHLIYQIIRAILAVFFKVFNRLEVIGYQNVPEKGGFIVATNHVSYLDPLVIGVALRRQATYIAKKGLFRVPFIGIIVKCFSLSVDRDKPQPSTIKEAVSRLKEGEAIVVFPEGGRSSHGILLDAKRGVGMIAAMSAVPVVPALIEGTDSALPLGAKFIRPAKIRVMFGNPLSFEKTKTGKHVQETISKEIMESIRNLKFNEQREKYG